MMEDKLTVSAGNTNHTSPHKSLLTVTLWPDIKSTASSPGWGMVRCPLICIKVGIALFRAIDWSSKLWGLSVFVRFEVILTQIRMKFCVQIGRRTSSVGQENDKIQYTFYRVVVARCNKCKRKTKHLIRKV